VAGAQATAGWDRGDSSVARGGPALHVERADELYLRTKLLEERVRRLQQDKDRLLASAQRDTVAPASAAPRPAPPRVSVRPRACGGPRRWAGPRARGVRVIQLYAARSGARRPDTARPQVTRGHPFMLHSAGTPGGLMSPTRRRVAHCYTPGPATPGGARTPSRGFQRHSVTTPGAAPAPLRPSA
jgi:hypothetical protein